MNQEPQTDKQIFEREMFVHIENLRARCQRILESADPFEVYNNVQSIRSIAGQVEKAAARWRFS